MKLSRLRLQLINCAAGSAFFAFLFVSRVQAAVFGGGGLGAGASPFGGMSTNTSIVSIILILIAFILNIVVVIAVLAVIIGGVYLIISNGDEAQKDKAKKLIFYAMIGIMVIVLARVIVLIARDLF